MPVKKINHPPLKKKAAKKSVGEIGVRDKSQYKEVKLPKNFGKVKGEKAKEWGRKFEGIVNTYTSQGDIDGDTIWNDLDLDVPNTGSWKLKKHNDYLYKITIALLTVAVVILLLMSMHTAQTEAINGWVN